MSDDSELLLQFERDNITDDYRLFYSIKRNNFFSSIQGLPEHWAFFSKIDEIWKRELGDLEVAIDPNRMFPVILYMNAHAKMRIGMELAFSSCMQEARSILRDAVENVAHAHHMLRDPANHLIWLKKDEPGGKKAFKATFEDNKKTNLFAGLTELYELYGQLSEAGSHPTMQSLTNRLSIEDRDGQRCMSVNYSGVLDPRLFAIELFSRLLACLVMERTLFDDYKIRLQLDSRLVRMRQDLDTFKETLRSTLVAKHNIQNPLPKATNP